MRIDCRIFIIVATFKKLYLDFSKIVLYYVSQVDNIT